MSWPLRLITYTKECSGSTLKVGDLFFFDPPESYKHDYDDDEVGWYWPGHFARDEVLSDDYRANNAGRKPLLVFLPGGILHCVDSKCWKSGPDAKTQYYGGWTVRGVAPRITVAPSILIGGSYHGFINDGVISDDVDGRKFNPDGLRVV